MGPHAQQGSLIPAAGFAGMLLVALSVAASIAFATGRATTIAAVTAIAPAKTREFVAMIWLLP